MIAQTVVSYQQTWSQNNTYLAKELILMTQQIQDAFEGFQGL